MNPSSVESYSFKDFYYDESIPGHSLLKPSIWVIESYGHIFSKVELDGCDAFLEVVSRIAKCALITIAAFFAFLIAVLGLIVKGICFPCAPEGGEPLEQPPPKTSSEATALQRPPAREEPKIELPPIIPIVEQRNLPVPEAHEALKSARQILSKAVVKRKVNLADVNKAKEILSTNPAIGEILKESNSRAQTSEAVPISPTGIEQELISLQCWVDALTYQYHFFNVVIEGEEGVIRVADNGDCLFESFLVHSELSESFIEPDWSEEKKHNIQWIKDNFEKDIDLQELILKELEPNFGKILATDFDRVKSQAKDVILGIESFSEWVNSIELYAYAKRLNVSVISYTAGKYENHRDAFMISEKSCFFKYLADRQVYVPYPAHQERIATVKWMDQYYKSDEKLQNLLVSSLTEHFLAKIEKLEKDLEGLSQLENLEIEVAEDIPKRKQEIEQHIESIYVQKIAVISKARGEVKLDSFGKPIEEKVHFELLEPLLGEYFEEMAMPTTFGGPAELYAMSCRHEVCVKVYSHGPVPTVFNEHFDSKPPRSLKHTGNHYNAYTPPS